MNPYLAKALAGAASGLLAAVAVDFHAWRQFPDEPYAWDLALPRWVAGAVLGAIAAFGIEVPAA
jgi:hypothetical protein